MSTQSIDDLPEVAQRFLRYVVIDTQSEEDVADYPSTAKQKDLGRLLTRELTELGLEDVRMDSYGYVTATLPARPGVEAPVIGWIAHVDTSPDVPGGPVRPVVHRGYPGGPLQLPGVDGLQVTPEGSPQLANCQGHDIVTSDGTTLLGADDKAGIAEIITACERLQREPNLRHGRIRVAFTCDEEVGRGTEHFDIGAFGADVAYTVDGETLGQIENETFCADLATVRFKGQSVHPGFAKGKLVNAVRGAAAFVEALAGDPAPETTERREGYLHPEALTATVEEATLRILVRDFEESGIERLEERLAEIAASVRERIPGLEVEVGIKEQYRNMRYGLDRDPRVVEFAMEAVRRAGVEPSLTFIRGGTDGAVLTARGLLTPNIFAGGHEFHSRREWVSIQDMEKAVDTLVALAELWAEKG